MLLSVSCFLTLQVGAYHLEAKNAANIVPNNMLNLTEVSATEVDGTSHYFLFNDQA